MNIRNWSALTCLLLLPSTLSGQTPEARIEAARARAIVAGIPVVLLENKVAEGRAKGIPMERIATAVEQRQVSLIRARTVIGGRDVPPADLAIAADALQVGVSEAALRIITERFPAQRHGVAIAEMTRLVEMGHASDQALARVTEALRSAPEALANRPPQTAAGREQAERRGRAGETGASSTESTGKATGASPGKSPPASSPGARPSARPGEGRGRPSGRPGGG